MIAPTGKQLLPSAQEVKPSIPVSVGAGLSYPPLNVPSLPPMPSVSMQQQGKLKALFNNVSTFNNLSCMALHAISVFYKV